MGSPEDLKQHGNASPKGIAVTGPGPHTGSLVHEDRLGDTPQDAAVGINQVLTAYKSDNEGAAASRVQLHGSVPEKGTITVAGENSAGSTFNISYQENGAGSATDIAVSKGADWRETADNIRDALQADATFSELYTVWRDEEDGQNGTVHLLPRQERHRLTQVSCADAAITVDVPTGTDGEVELGVNTIRDTEDQWASPPGGRRDVDIQGVLLRSSAGAPGQGRYNEGGVPEVITDGLPRIAKLTVDTSDWAGVAASYGTISPGMASGSQFDDAKMVVITDAFIHKTTDWQLPSGKSLFLMVGLDTTDGEGQPHDFIMPTKLTSGTDDEWLGMNKERPRELVVTGLIPDAFSSSPAYASWGGDAAPGEGNLLIPEDMVVTSLTTQYVHDTKVSGLESPSAEEATFEVGTFAADVASADAQFSALSPWGGADAVPGLDGDPQLVWDETSVGALDHPGLSKADLFAHVQAGERLAVRCTHTGGITPAAADVAVTVTLAPLSQVGRRLRAGRLINTPVFGSDLEVALAVDGSADTLDQLSQGEATLVLRYWELTI